MDLNKLWTNCKLNNVTRMTLFWPWVLHWQICDWFVSVALTEAMLFVAIDGKNWKIKLIQTSKFLIYFFVVLKSCKTWRSIFIKFMPIESMKEKLMVGLILTFALSSQISKQFHWMKIQWETKRCIYDSIKHLWWSLFTKTVTA